MSRKIKRTPQAALSIKGAFDEFVVAQTAKGFSESTIKNYHSHFHSISKHFDIEKSFGELTQTDIDGMIVSMRESGLAKFDLVFEISRFFFLLTNPAGASPGGMVTDEVGVSGTGSKVPQPAKRLIAWGVWRIRMPPSI